MPGTFQSAADGTFVSAIDGTFQSDMSGTFGPLLSWAGLDGTFATDMTPDVGTDGIPSTIYSVSDDGLVLGGSFSYIAFGTALQYPSIIVME